MERLLSAQRDSLAFGARLVLLRPTNVECFHRELVDVCPELRHLYFAHLGSQLSRSAHNSRYLPTHRPRTALRHIPPNLVFSLVDLLLLPFLAVLSRPVAYDAGHPSSQCTLCVAQLP